MSDDLDIGPADLEAFVRSGMGSLAEFLTLPVEIRAEILHQREIAEDARDRKLALYVAGACNGAHEAVAGDSFPEATEEASNLGALNAALGGAPR
jgi:hypothetical protein